MWEEAAEHLVSLQKLKWVEEEEARLWNASIMLGQGKYESLIHAYSSWLERSPKLLLPLAVAYARSGHHLKASETLERAKNMRLDNTEIIQGHLLAAADDYEGALLWYEPELQSYLDRARTAQRIGKTLVSLGDYREAAAAYAQAIRWRAFLYEKDVEGLAYCLRKLGKDSEAARWEQLIQASQAA
jgi:tetratricopeptide (TPR) repeat protein